MKEIFISMKIKIVERFKRYMKWRRLKKINNLSLKIDKMKEDLEIIKMRGD